MSLAALVGGVLRYRMLLPYLRRGADGPPLLRRLDSQRIFERAIILLSWRAARSAVDLLGTRRLQPQLRLLVGAALLAALWPLYRHGLQAGQAPLTAVDPMLALVWAAGAVCAVGAASIGRAEGWERGSMYGENLVVGGALQ